MTSVAQTLAGRSPFNVDTDLIGVSISVFVPFMWTAHPSVQARDLRELAQPLRTQKLDYNYGSTGPGSAMHVQGEAFKKEAQVAMQHVPFRVQHHLNMNFSLGVYKLVAINCQPPWRKSRLARLRRLRQPHQQESPRCRWCQRSGSLAFQI